jgi:hypothetical protein
VATFFLDSSALIKRHVLEQGGAWVRSLTSTKAGHTPYIARITSVEVYAAITRRQSGGSLSAAQAGAILGHFRRHLTQRYRVLEMTRSLMDDAMLLARKHRLRAYDAVRLSAALEVNHLYRTAGLAPVALISSDNDLNAAATAEGLAVDDPNLHR